MQMLRNETGAAAIAYALMAALIGAILVAGLPAATAAMKDLFGQIGSNLHFPNEINVRWRQEPDVRDRNMPRPLEPTRCLNSPCD